MRMPNPSSVFRRRCDPCSIIAGSAANSEAAGADLSAAYRSIAPELDDTRKQIAGLKEDLQNLNINTAMVMAQDKPGIRPAEYIRERGTFTSPGELVYADVPSAFNPLPKGVTPNRLALAEWLVSEDNPLTARVAVNHFWEAIFGHGIVETSEDFGTQGDPPSHPEAAGLAGGAFHARRLGHEKDPAPDGYIRDIPAGLTSDSGTAG